ncbi:hypothetical protein BDA96_03G051600 [Sorghum bicolor]|uniref:Uncharacterized protein n=2 Tax=Sorghum bicolor TaxID=4558 RepID=A0A921RB36_SORBI|nr:hypothetical protein BDA96_03G051600 [Sorghum bicolor]KXG31734.1 hypothetical protein SORBI_3003G048400 [Sorghum bicolor]
MATPRNATPPRMIGSGRDRVSAARTGGVYATRRGAMREPGGKMMTSGSGPRQDPRS